MQAMSAQSYPIRPIRIVTGEPGGGPDWVARLIAQGISGDLEQPIIVDNRGSSGLIPGDIASKAQPDGYTLLVSPDTLWLGPLLQKAPSDPLSVFIPISRAYRVPNVLIVHPVVPVRSVQDLVALAKTKPGALNYASASTGSATHLAAELFKVMAGVNIVRIPYKGGAQALNDLLGGQVQLMFATPASVAQHIKSGRVRAVAVASAHPSPLFPGLPTIAASGVPGYEAGVITGIFAPVRTPAPVISLLSQKIAHLLQMPEMKERFLNTGLEAVGSSPQEFAAVIRSDLAVWDMLIKRVGIRAD